MEEGEGVRGRGGGTRENGSEVNGADDALSFCSSTVGEAPSMGERSLESLMGSGWTY